MPKLKKKLPQRGNKKKGRTQKIEGTYGKYGVRVVGNHIETRIRKTINSIPTDFTGKGITVALAVADIEHKIELALNKDFVINTKVTVAEWCQQWLRTKKELESLSYFEQHIRSYINPVIGKMKLADVKLKDLNKITQKMASGELSEGSRKKGLTKKEKEETKKPLCKKTIQNVKGTISQIFQDAIDNEEIRNIPLHKINVPDVEAKEKIHLTTKQKLTLLNYLINDESESTKVASLMLLIQYLRGLRASEVCGLKVTDINFENKDFKLKQGVRQEKNT